MNNVQVEEISLSEFEAIERAISTATRQKSPVTTPQKKKRPNSSNLITNYIQHAPKRQRVAQDDGLPDFLAPDLDLVIIGDNPGTKSASRKQWYSHVTNHFWPMLWRSGLTPHQLTPGEDNTVMKYGIGLTCLVKRSTNTTALLSDGELCDGFKELLVKLNNYKPKVVCFNGIGIYKTVLKKSFCKVGWQDDLIVNNDLSIPCFVVPSSSARVKAYDLKAKVEYLKTLRSYST